MGSFYSYPYSNVQEDSSQGSSLGPLSTNSLDGENSESIYELDPLSVSVEDYEYEFRRICNKVSNSIESMELLPCQEASSEIMFCLKNNEGQMGKCLECMKIYQRCVYEATNNKLNKFVCDIKTY